MGLVLVATALFGIAFLFANVGLGGGLLYFPLLGFVYPEWPPARIVAMTLIFSIATLAAAVVVNERKKLVRHGLAMWAGIPMAAMAQVGAHFTLAASGRVVRGWFALVLAGVAVEMLRRDRRPAVTSPTARRESRASLAILVLSASAAGFLSGSAGIGAGVILVPVFTMIVGLETRVAVATSSMALLIGATSGTSAYAWSHRIAWDGTALAVLLTATFLGGLAGGHFAVAFLKARTVRRAFIAILFVTAFAMGAQLLMPSSARACPRVSGSAWGSEPAMTAPLFLSGLENCRAQKNVDGSAIYFTVFDGQEIFLDGARPLEPGIHRSDRAEARWNAPTLLASNGRWPTLTRDEQTVVFACDGEICLLDRARGQRTTLRFDGGTPRGADMPAIEPFGKRLVLVAEGEGGTDLYLSENLGEIWSRPVRIDPLSGSGTEGRPFFSYDGERLFFSTTSPELIADVRDRRSNTGRLMVAAWNAEATRFDLLGVVDEHGCL